jgi:ASC-1-like (ASCH) protein
MTKKEIYGWIEQGLKSVDIRRGEPKKGNVAVFVCGKTRLIRARILNKMEGELPYLLKHFGFRNVIPKANTLEEAMKYIEELYGTTTGTFTAYHFSCKSKK